jgi:hypothetical protein
MEWWVVAEVSFWATMHLTFGNCYDENGIFYQAKSFMFYNV